MRFVRSFICLGVFTSSLSSGNFAYAFEVIPAPVISSERAVIIPHPVGGGAFLDRPVQAGLVVGDPLLEVGRHVPHLPCSGVVVKDRKTDAAALRVPLGELEPLRVLPRQLVADVGKGVTVAGVVVGEPVLVPDDKVQLLPPLKVRFRIRQAVPLSARY